jgi:putative phosphoesterase
MKIGVLSDTHLTAPSPAFHKQVKHCFKDIDIIFHAGDLTELAILKAFDDKEVHAVHGNMCGHAAYANLPEKKIVSIGGFTFGLCHGAGPSHNIEERLWNDLGPVDCIIYGHTHHAVCHRSGPVLFMNPGSFVLQSRYGSPGTYGILEINTEIRGTIHTIGDLQ